MTNFHQLIQSPPSSRDAWETAAQDVRTRLWQLLGDLPPTFIPQPTLRERSHADGYTRESLMFDNGTGSIVYGTLLIPDGLTGPAPAVLYHHMHGGRHEIGKEELWQDWLIGLQPGPALVKAGYVVLAIDAYGFNEREMQGPAGERERGRDTETAWFKHFVWQGQTLWGMMVRDDQLALNYLCSRPEVDASRIAATGMSLGGSRTTWLAALDDRLKVVVPVAQMNRYAEFSASGNYNMHSIYYYVPGFRKTGLEMEALVSLVAPRPQMILIGDSDPLSPIEGVHKIIAYAGAIYDLYGASEALVTHIYPGMGHGYTTGMFSTMMQFLNKWL